ncbi:putative spermidine/putrescine transport system ATP-binding protein [Pseudochelatococcus lubricantis]|uniref:Spermidine/putrescine transport system ATP-binding protein n=1 Tax=Pseudochelatococcus lubricantis TaxID=1538102 RepID=A0ABX0UZQ6_9HYPH|nr:ABC transporter ATP-binding protein [Pseudochelatococcus lubricantis]NIJ58212.1 putative spermidine/putrescine transport system ATP-binding protein [Pseudochelatococcus lubricantis]
MSIEFRAVSYTYPGTRIGVSDIDLAIADGELLAIIGASGSGKSTLLKLLAGFLVPDSGRILVDGKDVTGLKPEDRQLGIVFQNYALFPHMSAAQNVAYPLKMRGIGRPQRLEQARAALVRVGLGDFTERRPATLSGGQQQRVALARSLVFSPRALLLDEPLSALDAALRVGMRDEILKVQRQADIATLHVTHDQEEALSLGDRVAVIAGGRIAQVAPPRELYERPATRAVAAFVGEANLWQGRIAAPGRVALANLDLAADTEGFAPGDVVTVMVRPERIGPAPASGINVFTGAVATDRYLGPTRRVDFAVDGVNVRLHTHVREAFSAISIPPDAIRLLPAD